MSVSPLSRRGASSSMDASTKAAGTMRQTARGLARFFTNSATGDAPVAPSLTSVSTASGGRLLDGRGQRSDAGGHVRAGVHEQRPPAVLGEHLEVLPRLGLFDDAEG